MPSRDPQTRHGDSSSDTVGSGCPGPIAGGHDDRQVIRCPARERLDGPDLHPRRRCEVEMSAHDLVAGVRTRIAQGEVIAALEHPRAEMVRAALADLGLTGLQPLSYLEALGIWARGGSVVGKT